MSSLSQFAPFAGGGLKSLQTGYVAATAASGSGEDTRYIDVTVSAVNTSKTLPVFYGAGSGSGINAAATYFYSPDFAMLYVIPRMTSTTNLRLANPNNLGSVYFGGRWYLAEAN